MEQLDAYFGKKLGTVASKFVYNSTLKKMNLDDGASNLKPKGKLVKAYKRVPDHLDWKFGTGRRHFSVRDRIKSMEPNNTPHISRLGKGKAVETYTDTLGIGLCRYPTVKQRIGHFERPFTGIRRGHSAETVRSLASQPKLRIF